MQKPEVMLKSEPKIETLGKTQLTQFSKSTKTFFILIMKCCVVVNHTDTDTRTKNKKRCVMISHSIKVCAKRSQEALTEKDVVHLDRVPLDIHAPSLPLFCLPSLSNVPFKSFN